MILVRIRNGLGNQMFQYAYGLILAKAGHDVKFDLSTLPRRIANRETHDICNIFDNPNIVIATPKDIRYVGEKFLYYPGFIKIWPSKLRMKLEKIANRYRKQNGTQFFHEPGEVWKIPKTWVEYMLGVQFRNNKNYYLSGFWEEEPYFIEHRELLIQEFVFKTKFDESHEVYNRIISTNSVSIHIRRGDYLTAGEFDYLACCSDEYYHSAIQYVESKVDNPQYIVFSDDIEYCKKLFADKENCVFVTGNKDYEDMQLMTLCKHNIVANSTFSFWGAFLNKNQGIVVAPKLHYVYRKEKQPIEKKYFQVDGWKYI